MNQFHSKHFFAVNYLVKPITIMKKLGLTEISGVEVPLKSLEPLSYRGSTLLPESLTQELRSFYRSPQEKRVRKNTIRVFFKPNDLDFYNLTRRNDYQQNSLNKNSTLQEVYLNKKKSEQIFKSVKSKGNIYINDLWSDDYYKKVMKFAHLQEIIDDIKENQRKKNIRKKIELMRKFQDENLSNVRRSENSSENLLDDYQLKSYRKTLNKSRKAKPRNFVSDGFVEEKKRFVTEIIGDCDKLNREFQAEKTKDVFFRDFEKEKKKRRADPGKNKNEELTHSLINFFYMKRKTAGYITPRKEQSLPPVVNRK